MHSAKCGQEQHRGCGHCNGAGAAENNTVNDIAAIGFHAAYQNHGERTNALAPSPVNKTTVVESMDWDGGGPV